VPIRQDLQARWQHGEIVHLKDATAAGESDGEFICEGDSSIIDFEILDDNAEILCDDHAFFRSGNRRFAHARRAFAGTPSEFFVGAEEIVT
jgi:hypothetical protein